MAEMSMRNDTVEEKRMILMWVVCAALEWHEAYFGRGEKTLKQCESELSDATDNLSCAFDGIPRVEDVRL